MHSLYLFHGRRVHHLNPIIRQMVNQKVRSLTAKDLIRQGRENNLNITVKQAKQILEVFQAQPFDIGNEKLVRSINAKLKKIDPDLYRKARKLMKPYESYLDFSLD